MDKKSKILVLGSTGLLGQAIVKRLTHEGFANILSPPHAKLELTDNSAVSAYFKNQRPEFVFMCAAKVGGILANSQRGADFLTQNSSMILNVMNAAHEFGASRLQFYASTCAYPKFAAQPMSESSLLTGELEKTSEAYAISKILGLKLAEYYKKQYGLEYHTLIPATLYGPGDNYQPENSHVISGLIARMHEAIQKGESKFVVWGTGTPKREFLHVDDLARACVHVMSLPKIDFDWMNVGCGNDLSIGELASLIAKIMGFKGEFIFDTSKPDGTPQKLLDISKISAMDWKPEISLEDGLRGAISDFKKCVILS